MENLDLGMASTTSGMLENASQVFLQLTPLVLALGGMFVAFLVVKFLLRLIFDLIGFAKNRLE
jgi:uncharacterized membrane protein